MASVYSISDEDIEKEVKNIIEKSDAPGSITLSRIRKDVESNLNLVPGSLKGRKEFMLEAITRLLSLPNTGEDKIPNDDDKEAVFVSKQLSRLARAAGKSPAIFKDISELDIAEKIKCLRERWNSPIKFMDAVNYHSLFQTVGGWN